MLRFELLSRRLALWGLYLVLAWAPLPLASNRPWAMGVLAVLAWVSAACGVSSRLVEARRGGPRQVFVPWPLLALVLVVAIPALQLSAPGALPWLRTMSAFDTRLYLLNGLSYLAVFTLVLACIRTAKDAQHLLAAVVVCGVVQAAIAVGLWASDASYLYFWTDFDQGSRTTGTYPNPDHLAGYMELCLAAGLGLMLSQFAGGTGQSIGGWQSTVAGAAEFLLSPKMLWRLLLVVMVVAQVMTHSRMGNGAFFLSLLLVGAAVAVLSKRLRKPALWLVVSMTLIDVLIISQWVGLEKLAQRMTDTAAATSAQAGGYANLPKYTRREESVQERLLVPSFAVAVVSQAPWFGHGGGTFVHAFPSVKPAGFPHYWDHAHNDYVEIASDVGLVGLGLLLALGLGTAWHAAQLLRNKRSRIKPGVGAAGLMAMGSMALHSMVDFNLQIPANALTLTALMALVWATRQVPPEPQPEKDKYGGQ